jgi:hypothetical protein
MNRTATDAEDMIEELLRQDRSTNVMSAEAL